MSPLNKYLNLYSEAETSSSSLVTSSFDYVLVVPSYRETTTSWNTLHNSINPNINCCIVLVVNRPDNKVQASHDTALLHHLQSTYPTINKQSNASVLFVKPNQQILLIDRCQQPVPKKQGVGLARKIGADIAASLIQNKTIKEPWIFTTDMDVTLPQNYFSSCHSKDNNISALLLPFRHQVKSQNKKIITVTKLYEAWLQHYVDGLAYAKSPYAFHTIGSTLIINAEHYGKVRGFPKISAGEDFHLLNKLAKTGAIQSLARPTIHIESRLSDRTPFGTGPAISQWMQSNSPKEEGRFYTPEAFALLKEWLTWVNSIDNTTLSSLKKDNHYWVSLFDQRVTSALLELKFDKNICNFLEQSCSPETLKKHIHYWFDALKTLRFIHILEKNNFEKISFNCYKKNCFFKTCP